MKAFVVALALFGLAVGPLHAQSAQEMKSGAPEHRKGETQEQKGKRLLDEMVEALGGDGWLDKQTMYREGQIAAFFRGEPTGSVVQYVEYRRFATPTSPELARIDFKSWRGVITPGKKKDVVHLWTADNGYEVTYKGQTELPKDQVADYMRRRAHSLEAVMGSWVKQPGVVIIADGSGMRDRHAVDKVTIMSKDNDSVTIEIDQTTHLPLQRSFQWRNEQFKDQDLDEEVYGDWRIFDGIATPMNMTNYRNGDMSAQNFYVKTHFNEEQPKDLYDPAKLLKK